MTPRHFDFKYFGHWKNHGAGNSQQYPIRNGKLTTKDMDTTGRQREHH